jgi:hypothetical protein
MEEFDIDDWAEDADWAEAIGDAEDDEDTTDDAFDDFMSGDPIGFDE